MNIDMKVKDLVKDPKFAEIIDKYVPGFSTDKQLKLAYPCIPFNVEWHGQDSY